MRGLVAGELAEQVVDLAGLHVLGQAGDEQRPDLVVRAVRDDDGGGPVGGERRLVMEVREVGLRRRRRRRCRRLGRRGRLVVSVGGEGPRRRRIVGRHVVHRRQPAATAEEAFGFSRRPLLF